MTRARQELVDLSETAYYHCICRCVRRAFLCGEDHLTGKNYEHRKEWVVDRLSILSRANSRTPKIIIKEHNYLSWVMKTHKQQIVYSLLAFTMLLLIAACGGSSNDGVAGDDNNGNTVAHQGKIYAITAGLKRDFELNRQFSPLSHSSSAIQISDGEFFSTLIFVDTLPITVWRPRDASVWLRMNLYALGT